MASKYQKRHYEDVARLIRQHYSGQPADPLGSTVRGHIGYLARDFADLFAADNPNFDRGRFLKACGLGTEG